MRKRLNRKLYILLAAWMILTIFAVAAIVLIFRLESIRTQAEDDAALAAHRILAPVLGQQVGDISDPTPASFAEIADGLLSDQVWAIRLWSYGGELLATTGKSQDIEADPVALARATAGNLEAARITSPQGDILVSYAPVDTGTVLEIDQDYSPIAASVATSRRLLLVAVVGSAILLLLLVQGMLLATTHDLKREYERALAILHTGYSMRDTLDPADVLEQLVRDAASFTQAPLAIATLVEEKTDDLLVKASYDREQRMTSQHHRRVEEWYMRRCAGTGETVQAELERLPYDSLLGYEPKKAGPVVVLCVAIRGPERTLGILTLVRWRTQGKFNAAEVRMAEELAAQGAMAVEQAILFAKVRSHADELELSYDTTLRVLVAALDTKDAVTHGHSERVSRLTVTLAREIGLPKEQLVDIERGALLHDVGKIGVPDEVLHKPAALNDGEWEAMQKHPLLAGLMVSKVGFLEGAMPILLYHHERYDGGGYPFGLEGGAIPLEARIFAVVDSYDAMTSDRPYRKAMSHEAAMLEIKRNAGIQFDPNVVDAFARVMTNGNPAEQQAA